MSSRSRKRRRRLIKYGAIAAATGLGIYGLSKVFGGSGDDAPGGEIAGPDAATEGGGEGMIAGPTISTAGIFSNPAVLLGIGAVALLLIWKK